jgi:hypothetical protein
MILVIRPLGGGISQRARSDPHCNYRCIRAPTPFRNASITIAEIELMHRIRKGQFNLGRLRIKDDRVTEIWNAVLAA